MSDLAHTYPQRSPNYLVLWDPVLGCSKVSPSCKNCIGERTTLLKDLHPKYARGFTPRYNEAELEKILYLDGISHSQVIVAGVSDLFHEKIEDKYIFEVLDLIKRLPNHAFQVGTKRSERMMELSYEYGGFPVNLQMVVTVETSDYYNRIRHLEKAKVLSNYKGLGLKPLLSNMPKMPLKKNNLVHIGRECFTKEPRITKQKWINEVFKQCCEHKVPFRVDDSIIIYEDPVSLFIKSLLFQLVVETNGLTVILGPNHPKSIMFSEMLQEEISQFELATSHNFYQCSDKIPSLITENPQMVSDLAKYVREKRPSYFYKTG